MHAFGRLSLQGILGFFIILCCSTTSESVMQNKIQSDPQMMGSIASMRVLWRVSKYILGTNAKLGDEEASKLLFKPLDITATTINFDGKRCTDVIFKKEKVNAKEYLNKTFHITPQALDIADETLELIKTNCNLPGFSEYLRLSDGRLIIHINGVFFFLAPNVNF